MKRHRLEYAFFKNWQSNPPKAPLLLAISGGPDSTALFYLLKHVQHTFPFAIHFAHVHHNIRQESDQEFEHIKNLAKQHHIPLHTKKLQWTSLENFEARARNQRLEFFEELLKNTPCQTLVLGHHRIDQAENVLKRLFEGAHIFSYKGMQTLTTHAWGRVYRPLLPFSKQELIQYLDSRNIPYATDITNTEGKNTRAIMRKTLFPTLETAFGKSIISPLNHIADESQELYTYLEETTREWTLTPSVLRQQAPFLVKFFLHKILRDQGETPNQEQLRSLLHCIQKPQGPKQVVIGHLIVHVTHTTISLAKR